jgi:hypothetical protein
VQSHRKKERHRSTRKVRLYARVGQALIEPRSSGGDVFAAIEAVLPWPKFESTVAEAQTLAQPEEFDYLSLLAERYSSLRKFAPLLLANFEFHSAPAAAELLQALDLLRDPRDLNASGKRTLPEARADRFRETGAGDPMCMHPAEWIGTSTNCAHSRNCVTGCAPEISG